MSKQKNDQTNLAPEASRQSHGGDYSVKRSKRTDMVARVLAILAAVLLWAYVSTTNSTTEERDFSLVPVTYREESMLKNEYGLIVQTINIDTLNVTLMGNKTDIRAITASDVKAYVNLGDITEAGEYTLDVYVDVPSGTTCVAQTVDKVVVSVDKPSTKVLPLTSDSVELNGWSLDQNYEFGNITINTEQIVLEGPTLELDKIEGLKVRTDMIGSANSTFTSTASIHYIDAEGAEILGSGVSVQGKNRLQVTVEVLKTVKADLRLKGKNGLIPTEQVALTPAEVWLKGEAHLIDELLVDRNELIIETELDESALTEDTRQSWALSIEGIEITDSAGNAIESVSALVKAAPEIDLTHTLTDVPVYKNVVTFDTTPEGDITPELIKQNAVKVGTVTVELTATDLNALDILKMITNDSISVWQLEGKADLIVYFDRAYIGPIADYKLSGYKGVS